jgi:hypothetical protein
MTSNTLKATEALVHDIGEQELDFSDLFLCDGFASDPDQGLCFCVCSLAWF